MQEERLPLILSFRFSLLFWLFLRNAEGGDALTYFVVQIQDIQMMACFLDFLSKEDMNIKVTGKQRKVKIQLIYILKDSFGDSLLHYVAAAMDEEAIFKVVQLELFFLITLLIIYVLSSFLQKSNGNEVICAGDVISYFG